MRIDVRTLEGQAFNPCTIYLDGRPLEDRCFLADEEAGEAHCYVSTSRVILDDDGNLATEILRGKVEIRPVRESGRASA